MPVDMFVQASIGAAGAPTLVAANSKGITSISRLSAGRYSIIINDKYVRLINVNAMFLVAGVSAVANVNVFSQAVATTGQVVIQCSDIAGAAVDPGNGEQMNINIILSNSTAS